MNRAQADIVKAALWLEQEARDTRISHTVTGRWPKVMDDPIDQEAKARYDEGMALANRLRAYAKTMK